MYVIQFSHDGATWQDQATYYSSDFYLAKEYLNMILESKHTKGILFSEYDPDSTERVVFWRLVGRVDKPIIE